MCSTCFSAVWKLSLAGVRKGDLKLCGVFSSLQSTAPEVINDGLGGDRDPGTQAASLALSLAILTVKNLHGLWSCLLVRPVASSNITVSSTSSENQCVPHAPLTHSRLWR